MAATMTITPAAQPAAQGPPSKLITATKPHLAEFTGSQPPPPPPKIHNAALAGTRTSRRPTTANPPRRPADLSMHGREQDHRTQHQPPHRIKHHADKARRSTARAKDHHGSWPQTRVRRGRQIGHHPGPPSRVQPPNPRRPETPAPTHTAPPPLARRTSTTARRATRAARAATNRDAPQRADPRRTAPTAPLRP